MHTIRLKRVGGPVILTAPPALPSTLSLGTGNEAGMVIDNGRLIVEPYKHPRYSLAELLTQCGPNAEMSAEEREWLDTSATSQEEIWHGKRGNLACLT